MSDLSCYSDEDIINILSSNAEAELKKRGYIYGWHKKNPFVGAIYILVNPAFPTLVKIGYADDVQKRMKTLNSNSGIPDPYHCYAIYKVKKRLEDLKLHNLIDTLDSSLRHTKNREFYDMNCQKAYDILSAIAQINGDEEQLIYNPYSDHYFEQSVFDGENIQDSQKQKQSWNIMVSLMRFLNLPQNYCILVRHKVDHILSTMENCLLILEKEWAYNINL